MGKVFMLGVKNEGDADYVPVCFLVSAGAVAADYLGFISNVIATVQQRAREDLEIEARQGGRTLKHTLPFTSSVELGNEQIDWNILWPPHVGDDGAGDVIRDEGIPLSE